MSVISLMLKKAELGDVNPADGTISNWVEIAIYENTLKINEGAPTKTKHRQSGKTAPRKVVTVAGEEVATFQIMDGDPDTAALAIGGTVTTVDLKKSWNKPKGNPPEVIKAFRGTTVDDYQYIINRGVKTGRKVMDFGDTNIALWEVEIEATDTGFPLIPDVQWKQV